MNSPNAVSIVLLATLFALTINNSNGVDPRSLWSFIKQTAANGNQYFSNWLNYIFGSSSEQQDMNLITSTVMSMETGRLQSKRYIIWLRHLFRMHKKAYGPIEQKINDTLDIFKKDLVKNSVYLSYVKPGNHKIHDLVCEGLYTFMSFGNEDYRKPISGNITPRDIRFSIKSL
ncbi:hypothetical protein HZH66_005005 [Vespula vulgaris]|uniref:Uncharacterized protein n=1 Tax=Vespula vulgaris TaxID=7454 RepID=A0A834NCT6_VESVU|nr:hypothetical protein HZH66_005005 [Vespula vulgaris]